MDFEFPYLKYQLCGSLLVENDMYKKSSGIIVLFMIATMILVACRTSTTNTKEIDCTKTEILCVGLVTGLGGSRINP
jgi:surface polysaccharide O-acyltransferase-like enzyme